MTITGSLESDVKILKDGSAETVIKFKNDDNERASIAVLKISKNLYKKHKSRLLNKTAKSAFTGRCRVAVNSKGIPYAIIDVTGISKHREKVKRDIKNPGATEEINQGAVKKATEKIKVINEYVHWNKKIDGSEFVEIETSKIHLVEDIHKKGIRVLTGIYDDAKIRPIAVRKMDNGNYALVTGLKSYIIAKVFNKESLKCYITDLKHKEFNEKYEIVEGPRFRDFK